MGGEWTTCTLADVAAATASAFVDGPFGSALPASDYTPTGVPVIRGSNLTLGSSRFVDEGYVFVSESTAERLHRALCRPGDIVFTKKGTIGQTGIVPSGSRFTLFLLSSNQMKLTVDPSRADPLFVYYAVSCPGSREKIIRDASVTGVPKINLGYIRQFPISLPALPVQRAIAHILGTLDDKIELNGRTNETLEAMARALFKSWFVDFDPVRAKAAGRQPSGIDAETAKLFPSEFEESELGEIPKGWRAILFLDFAELLSGGTPKTSVPEYWNGDIKWASARDVSQCGSFFLVDSERMISREGLQHSATKMIPAGSVVVVARGATCGRFTVLAETMAMNQTCYALTPRVPEARWYLRFLSEQLLVRLVAQAHGSVFDTITTGTFERAQTLDPGPQALEQFETAVTPIVERIRRLHYEDKTLTRLRDALLPRLLSGELSVPDAARVLEAQA